MANSKGSADWDHNGKPDFIFGDDPRYLECLKVAKALKADPAYGGKLAGLDSKNPTDLAEITRIERHMVATLSERMHEQFGAYNPAVNLENASEDTSINGDWERRNSANPLHATELKRDTAICRHQAAMGHELCSEAGMNTRTADTVLSFFKQEGDTLVPMRIADDQHMIVLSKATGKIIDFTEKGTDAYQDNLVPTPAGGVTYGSTLLTPMENNMVLAQKLVEVTETGTRTYLDDGKETQELWKKLTQPAAPEPVKNPASPNVPVDVQADARAAVNNIPPELLAQIRSGTDNIGHGIAAGVGVEKGAGLSC